MIDELMQVFAPHICEGCGRVGKPLCARCINYIIDQKWTLCVNCNQQMTTTELAKSGNLCRDCCKKLPFKKVFVVGERSGLLQSLVGNYKYFSRRESAKPIAKLVFSSLPSELPPDLTVVPLPTIPKHIRQRGFDHMKLVARELARLTELPKSTSLLKRVNNLSQHGANLKQRKLQAEQAFRTNLSTKMPERVLLIDDIYTTGNTTKAAAKMLKSIGVKEIWLAIVARHNSQ